MDVLTSDFLKRGAFITDSKTGEILLGEGGELSVAKKIEEDGSFYLKDFFEDKYLRYTPARWRILSAHELLSLLGEEDQVEFSRGTNEDAFYQEDFNALLGRLGGELQKAVLISREEFTSSSPIRARARLIRRALTFGTGIPYGLWSDEYGVIGSTPELLFRREANELYTYALAGTMKQGKETQLLNSTKDRLEHELVVKDIEEKLAAFTNEILIDKTGTLSFRDLVHLKTDIRCRLRPGTDLNSITASLSPTAALGGYPRELGLAFLKSTRYQARHPERYFGSAFGVARSGPCQFVVSIRNVQWRGERFFIESGGGVVQGSELEKELEEISLKRRVIREHYLCP